jgi:hypothetical protein
MYNFVPKTINTDGLKLTYVLVDGFVYVKNPELLFDDDTDIAGYENWTDIDILAYIYIESLFLNTLD